MAQGSAAAQGRVRELDGLRGWASFSVMLAHLVFGVFVKADTAFIHPALRPVLETFLGGTFDVAVFFVLSGDVLSTAFWLRDSRGAAVAWIVKRYIRLVAPIFCSCLIVFALIKADLIYIERAANLLNVQDWLGTFLNKRFDVADLIAYAGFGVLAVDDPTTALNPFLGTMPLEWAGGLFVCLYIVVEPRLTYRYALLIAATVFFMLLNSFLACFPFGILCSRIRSNGGFARVRGRPRAELSAVVAAGCALVAATYCNRIWPGWLVPSILGACIFVSCVSASSALSRAFSGRLSARLGRLSFPLYLMHFSVIASLTSGLVILAHAYGMLGAVTIWAIILCSAAVSLVAAALFVPLERLAIRTSNSACRAIIGQIGAVGSILASARTKAVNISVAAATRPPPRL